MSHSRIGLSALVLAATVALPACSVNLNAERVEKKEEKRFTVTGRPDLTLKTFDGSITVQSWDKSDVLVMIQRTAGNQQELDSIEVKSEQQGDRITVEAVAPERTPGVNIGVHIGRSVNFTVTVPRGTDLTARSGDGSVTIEAVTGRIALHTGDGGIRGRALSGDISVRTGDGSVALEEITGTLELNTGDGSVQVSGMLDRLQAHTGDGAVNVRASKGTRVAEDWEITTGDGPVTLELPDAFDAELDAHTGDGRVQVEGFAVPAEALEGGGEGRSDVKARLGAGGRTLTIRSGDGTITVKKTT